jgi:hypothetical protein
MFDYWRQRYLTPLLGALGLQDGYSIRRFESTHPTGLPGTSPHLDLELVGPGLPPVGIESKFTEPYGRVTNDFRPSYCSSDRVWTDLPSLRRMAEDLANGVLEFRSLHAAQLTKHLLGLSNRYGSQAFLLVYIWFRVSGEAGNLHAGEVHRFLTAAADEVNVRAVTYQEVFDRLTELEDEHLAWRSYMVCRYLTPITFERASLTSSAT